MGLYDASTGQRVPVTLQGVPSGDSLALTTVRVAGALRLPTLHELGIETADSATWSGLSLVGHSLYPVGRAHEKEPPVIPGDVLESVLFWRKDSEDSPPEALGLRLTNRIGEIIWSEHLQPAYGDYAWTEWREREIVRDIRHIALPADLVPGTYRLMLSPLSPDKGPTVELARIRIAAR